MENKSTFTMSTILLMVLERYFLLAKKKSKSTNELQWRGCFFLMEK